MADTRRNETIVAMGLVPVILVLLAAQAWELHRFAERQIGIAMEQDDASGELRLADVLPTSPADDAGLRAGDVLLELEGVPLRDLDDVRRVKGSRPPRHPLELRVERGGEEMTLTLVPGAQFPLFPFTVAILTALCYLAIGPLALLKRPGYLRARLLLFFTAAVAVEIAMPGAWLATGLWLVAVVLLSGVQMPLELHLASVIPERQKWLQRAPWAIPAYYVVGIGSGAVVATAMLDDALGWHRLPGEGQQLYEPFVEVVYPLWALGVLLLLLRQAWTYPEARGRQQAAIVAAGIVPWVLLVVASNFDLVLRWMPAWWEDTIWNLALLPFPLAVFLILLREKANQDRIVLDLTDQVQRVASVQEISRVVSVALHSAFHPKSTHVFYRQRHSRDLTLGHSTGIRLEEEVIPENSPLLRLVELYGKAVDYPEDLVGLPPPEKRWLEELAARLVVPLVGRDHRLLGLLVLGQKKSEEPYTPHDRKLLQALTNQIALVYENARLKDRVDQSQRIQQQVLARLGEQELHLVRECPTCGACYDADQELCAIDGSELLPSLPIERTIGGRYRLERRIDRGGMGAIYEARDLHLERQVAVKVLLGSLASGDVLRRFEHEARMTARLRHPNIVTIHDYGTTDSGAAFLVLELLAGTTLESEIARRGRLAPELAARWLDQVCEAVQAAHDADIVHRDLKPANVYLAGDDDGERTVKILDFGVAKVRSAVIEEGAGLTAPGALIGTFRYMAPEQLEGREADARSDVFAIAVMALEALSGRRPFTGEGPAELLRSIAAGPPALSGPQPWASRVDAVVRRALALEPDARHPDVRRLRADLIPALSGFDDSAVAGSA
ncbi:MAG TPA: protein kinase [Thermoanaerobaculia bacterium]|nr:protein kinase [Thermoanaerobaculia bacterium]